MTQDQAMSELTNLPREMLRRTLAKLERTGQELELEILRTKRGLARVKRARERRKQREAHPSPRLTVVKD